MNLIGLMIALLAGLLADTGMSGRFLRRTSRTVVAYRPHRVFQPDSLPGRLPFTLSRSPPHFGHEPTSSRRCCKHVPSSGNRDDIPDELLPDCWRRRLSGARDVMGHLEWDKPSNTKGYIGIPAYFRGR